MKTCLPTHLNISIGNNHQVKKAGDQGKRHPGRKSWSVVNFCAPTFWSPCWQSFPCCCWWPSGAPCPHYQRHLESAEAVYNCCTTERNYAECATLCTVGKGTYKIPWGHFMLYGVYAWRRFANLHQTPFDTNLSKYFFHAMGNTTKAKSCEMLYVVASNTPKKCMKNIVMMLTLLTFSHSMTNTKHQHQIHHLHR